MYKFLLFVFLSGCLLPSQSLETSSQEELDSVELNSVQEEIDEDTWDECDFYAREVKTSNGSVISIPAICLDERYLEKGDPIWQQPSQMILINQ